MHSFFIFIRDSRNGALLLWDQTAADIGSPNLEHFIEEYLDSLAVYVVYHDLIGLLPGPLPEIGASSAPLSDTPTNLLLRLMLT